MSTLKKKTKTLKCGTKGINGHNSEHLAFWWQLCGAGLLSRGQSGGPEAGSVPTVPWQENVQPSRPRQLGYSQGAVENWRAEVSHWSWGGVWGGGDAGRGRGDESGTLCFNSILVLQGHGICCVWRAKKPKFGYAMRTLCLSWPSAETVSPPAGTTWRLRKKKKVLVFSAWFDGDETLKAGIQLFICQHHKKKYLWNSPL